MAQHIVIVADVFLKIAKNIKCLIILELTALVLSVEQLLSPSKPGII